MAISIAICIPVPVALAVILAIFGVRGTIVDILTVVAFLASFAIGVLISMKKNVSVLGKTAGLAFSVFGIVYIIGSLVALWGLLVVIFRLIIQILIICAAILSVGFALDKGGASSSSSGPAPGSTLWIDKDGGRHRSQSAAEEANKRIAERKTNH